METVDFSIFAQFISELSQDADDLKEKIKETDESLFLLGKKNAYCEILNKIKETFELTDQDISKMRLKFPCFRTIRFADMNDTTLALLKCFKTHNIQTVGDFIKLNAESMYSVLEMNREYVALLIVLFSSNNIPTKYLDGLCKVCDEHYQEKMRKAKAQLEKLSTDTKNYSHKLGEIQSSLNQIKSEVEKLYAVTAISFADIEGSVCKDENAPMRLVTISNSKIERNILLSTDEIKNNGIKVGTILTITEN